MLNQSEIIFEFISLPALFSQHSGTTETKYTQEVKWELSNKWGSEVSV